MKLVTWNCNGAFRKKFQLLDSLSSDIVVIQECEDPAQSNSEEYKEWAGHYAWVGKNKHKGLGVFSPTNLNIKVLNWPDYDLELFLPICVNNELNLLAAWTKHQKTHRYIGQLWRYLSENEEYVRSNKQIICGDLNSNVIWDKPWREWNHSSVIKMLEEKHIYSLYHKHFKEEQGRESSPTLFMQRNKEKPYHIDYIFASNDLANAASNFCVGAGERWLEFSDHMPVYVDIDECI